MSLDAVFYWSTLYGTVQGALLTIALLYWWNHR